MEPQPGGSYRSHCSCHHKRGGPYLLNSVSHHSFTRLLPVRATVCALMCTARLTRAHTYPAEHCTTHYDYKVHYTTLHYTTHYTALHTTQVQERYSILQHPQTTHRYKGGALLLKAGNTPVLVSMLCCVSCLLL